MSAERLELLQKDYGIQLDKCVELWKEYVLSKDDVNIFKRYQIENEKLAVRGTDILNLKEFMAQQQ